MQSHTLRAALVAAIAVSPLAFSSPNAGAADSQVGQTATTEGRACDRGPATILQSASAGSAFTVPADGVITSVRMSGDPSHTAPRGFRLARGGGNTWSIVGRAGQIDIPAGQSVTQAVRIPARAGDVLGEYVADNATSCLVPAGDSDVLTVYYSDLPDATPTSSTASGPGNRISVAATLEPDADGDGFGDTTQDRCPSNPTTQGACTFAPGSLGAPQGKPKVGKRLTAPAVVAPAGATETYQWFRVGKVKAHRTTTRPISGAASASYKVKGKDRGKRLFVRITLSAPGRSHRGAPDPGCTTVRPARAAGAGPARRDRRVHLLQDQEDEPMSSPSHTQDAEPTLTCFLHLTALPSWLAMTRPERNEFVEQRLTPIVTAAAADVSIRWIDVEAFTADCSDVVIAECRSLDAWNSFVEALRDTPIFSVPLFQLDRVLVGVEEGFRRHEEST